MPATLEFLSLPEVDRFVESVLRLVAAALLGGLLGAERESIGKDAGLRTHMLVALGAALFALLLRDETADAQSRVIQGVATGIGFIGAGTILKHAQTNEVTGLTTAASLWLTAAIGVTAGVATIWHAAVATVAAWIVLTTLTRLGSQLSHDASRRR
jgi:putative Mg2+ transporter-C (MgtC) family protein